MYSLTNFRSILTFFFFISTLLTVPGLPAPDPAAIQPFQTSPSPPATIPAFPEQSDAAGCRLDLPEQFFRGVKAACGGGGEGGELRRGRCCPVLATWLYSAYSSTALGRRAAAKPVGRGNSSAAAAAAVASFDMPLLPDDSETCVGEVDKELRRRGVELRRPNDTCDVVYCYCGVRLHPLSCPDSFSVGQEGKLVGGRRVKRLERDCLATSNAFPGLGGCSKCLHSLRLLNNNNNNNKALNTSKLDERTTKMHNKDCEMMGLTWLLAKNRTAYMHTVSAVIRAIMMSPEGADHRESCALSSDGLPLAVDSSDISDQSSSVTRQPLPISLFVALISLLYIQFNIALVIP